MVWKLGDEANWKWFVVRTSLMEHVNVRPLLANAVKNGRWVSYTFLQKPYSFKSFSILEENYAADIINEALNSKTFVGKCCKKEPLSKLYLPTKAKSFQSFLNSSIILKKFLCLQKQRFWGNQYLKLLMAAKCDEEKNSFSNQVVKDKMVFALFFVKSNGFEFKRSISDFFFAGQEIEL